MELHGDRASGDDEALRCGLAWVGDSRCVFLDSDEHALSAVAARQALRMVRLAEHLRVPLLLMGTMAGVHRPSPAMDASASAAHAGLIAALSVASVALVALVREVDEGAQALYDLLVVSEGGGGGRWRYDAGSPESLARAVEDALAAGARLTGPELETLRQERVTDTGE
jgi:sugar phosphate isomerase/epimerase